MGSSRLRFFAAPLAAAAVLVALTGGLRADSTDRPPAAPAAADTTYGGTIDRVMGQIVAGRIDEALGAIEFLKQQPDTRAALRDHLVQLANQQQHLYGYDIAAVQRFSERLQTVSVLAYYEQQPILF